MRSLRVYLIRWADEYFTIVLDLPLVMVFGTNEFLATIYYSQVEGQGEVQVSNDIVDAQRLLYPSKAFYFLRILGGGKQTQQVPDAETALSCHHFEGQ